MTRLVRMLEFVRDVLPSRRLFFENELRCDDSSDDRAAGLLEGLLSKVFCRHSLIVLCLLGGAKSFVGAVVMIEGVSVRASGVVGTGGGFESLAFCPIAESEAWRNRIRLKRGFGFTTWLSVYEVVIWGISGVGEDGLREICSLERANARVLVASRFLDCSKLRRSRRSVSLRLPLFRLNIIYNLCRIAWQGQRKAWYLVCGICTGRKLLTR